MRRSVLPIICLQFSERSERQVSETIEKVARCDRCARYCENSWSVLKSFLKHCIASQQFDYLRFVECRSKEKTRATQSNRHSSNGLLGFDVAFVCHKGFEQNAKKKVHLTQMVNDFRLEQQRWRSITDNVVVSFSFFVTFFSFFLSVLTLIRTCKRYFY